MSDDWFRHYYFNIEEIEPGVWRVTIAERFEDRGEDYEPGEDYIQEPEETPEEFDTVPFAIKMQVLAEKGKKAQAKREAKLAKFKARTIALKAKQKARSKSKTNAARLQKQHGKTKTKTGGRSNGNKRKATKVRETRRGSNDKNSKRNKRP